MSHTSSEQLIQNYFSQASDPKEAIDAIQRDLGKTILPNTELLYTLLELSGCSRAQIHEKCLEVLKRALIQTIESDDFGYDQ